MDTASFIIVLTMFAVMSALNIISFRTLFASSVLTRDSISGSGLVVTNTIGAEIKKLADKSVDVKQILEDNRVLSKRLFEGNEEVPKLKAEMDDVKKAAMMSILGFAKDGAEIIDEWQACMSQLQTKVEIAQATGKGLDEIYELIVQGAKDARSRKIRSSEV